MKLSEEDIPVVTQAPGTIMRSQPDFGNMTVAYHALPQGTDFTPLLKGLGIDFSPTKELDEVMKNVAARMAEAG